MGQNMRIVMIGVAMAMIARPTRAIAIEVVYPHVLVLRMVLIPAIFSCKNSLKTVLNGCMGTRLG